MINFNLPGCFAVFSWPAEYIPGLPQPFQASASIPDLMNFPALLPLFLAQLFQACAFILGLMHLSLACCIRTFLACDVSILAFSTFSGKLHLLLASG
jgi:hypothetical protein